MTLRQFCTNCGAALSPGVRFCENCGQAVATGLPTTPPARPVALATVQSQRKFPWWTLFLAGGCLALLCLVVVAGGGLLYIWNSSLGEVAAPPPVVTQVIVTQESLSTATPIVPSPAPAPTELSLTLTGYQRIDDHSLYDDFSSEALLWPIFDDGATILKYENGAYSFQIAEQDYYDWAYFPVDFVPYEIWFDVQGPPGQQDGTFGVFCQFQDIDNHYYVEFDLQDNSYIIAQYLDGEDIPLTKQNAVGQFWYKTDAFKSSPDAVNRIGVSCYLEEITLFINEQLVDQVDVPQPFNDPGEAAFFVYAFDFAGPQGYKVFFDNVETWQPVQ